MNNNYVYGLDNDWQNGNNNWQNNWDTYNLYQNVHQSGTNASNKKAKKHKHGGCLTFLLKIVFIVVLVILAKKGLDYWARSDVERFSTYYPFSFSDENDRYNVTDDFYILTVFYDESGKKYNADWDIDNKYISKVSETDEYLEYLVDTLLLSELTIVELNAIYRKFFFGKAEITYEIVLVPSSKTLKDTITPVNADEAESGTYPYKIQIRKNTDGYITSYTGDIRNRVDDSWKILKVLNLTDAYEVLNSYKSVLSIPSEVDFILDRDQTVNDVKNYIFILLVNEIKLDGNFANVLVNILDNSVTDISCLVSRQDLVDIILKISNSNVSNLNIPNDDSIKELLASNLLFIDTCGDSGIYSLNYIDTRAVSGTLAYIYSVTMNDLGIYSVAIDTASNQIISINDLLDTFLIPGPTDKDFDGEQVDGKYTDEYGVNNNILLYKIQSKGWFNDKTLYTLHDASRQITVFDETFLFDLANSLLLSQDGKNVLDVFKALGKLGLWQTINLFNLDTSKIINFESPDLSDRPAASLAYKNVQAAYDWYNKELGIVSYDNNGSPMLIVDKYGKMTDNAACVKGDDGLSYFILCVPKKLKYLMCNDLTVMGHEYTHAVFNDQIGNIQDAGIELDGINEGCADIFGVLMNPDVLLTWKIGKNAWADSGETVYARDIANYSGSDLLTLGPKIYHGEGWEDEEHTISVLILHIAYEMYNSGKFLIDDIAKIWLNSMSLGYNASLTFVDCRKNVMKSMLILGYSKELQDLVAGYWDAEEIFDPDYVITTTSESDDVLSDELDSETLEKLSTGDLDTVLFMLAFGTLLQDVPIYIWQETPLGTAAMLKDEQQQFSELLLEVYGYKVEYIQIDSTGMGILKFFIGDANNKIDLLVSNSLDDIDSDSEEAKFINIIIKLAFFTGYEKLSPYDIYTLMYVYSPINL